MNWCSVCSNAGTVPLIYRAIYVPTLTYGHELWVVTERMRSRIQAAKAPRDPPGGTGECGWGQGSLGGPA